MYRFASYEARQADKARRHAEYLARQSAREERQREYEARQVEKEARHAITEKYNAGVYFSKNNQMQEAVNCFTDVINSNNQYTAAYLKRGVAYVRLGMFDAALNNYNMALQLSFNDQMFHYQDELKSRFEEVYSKIGSKQFHDKKYEASIASYTQALSYVAEDNSEQKYYCYYYRGLAYKEIGNISQAISDLQNAVNFKPTDTRALEVVAKLYETTSNFTQALACYTQAAQQNPGCVSYYQSKSFCFKKLIETATGQMQVDLTQQHQNFLQEVQQKFQEEKWINDDLRWLKLGKDGLKAQVGFLAQNHLQIVRKSFPSINTASHFDSGEYEYTRIILNWSIDDIRRVDNLMPLLSAYADVKNYYDSLIPLILEESKAALRQELDNSEGNFQLHISKIIPAKKANNPGKIFTNSIPKKYLESSQNNIALWMTFQLSGGGDYSCLGMATVADGETQIKFLSPQDESLKQILHAKSVGVHYLGSLVTHSRMFAICYEKPDSPFIKQISAGRLNPWSENAYAAQKLAGLDESQNKAIFDFLNSAENNLYLLQGPPGTGKTTTIVALLEECVKRKLRVLVTAPSNKAIQEIASRIIKQNTTTKMMLAGVEEKITDDLLDIFVHGWHQRMLDQLNKMLEQVTNLEKHLKNADCQNENASIILQFTGVTNRLQQFHSDTATELQELARVFQACFFQLGALTKESKEQWLGFIRQPYDDASAENHAQSISPVELEQYLQEVKSAQNILQQLYAKFSDSEEIELDLLEQAEIVFASLSVCGRASLQRLQNEFAVTVIDEAGQAVIPETLLPLRFPTKKALFVGDPMQLPATTLSETASQTQFADSILSRLILQNRAPHKMLRCQYRMDPQIRQFPSEKFYQGLLLDGDNIQTRTNPIAGINRPFFPYGFVDIKEGREIKQGNSFYNDAECDITGRLVGQIHTVDPSVQIGVITFYRAQLEKLQQRLAKIHNVVVATVDGFQGGECDVVLISCVRANTHGNVGFAKDFRRINVALTRARFGLVILGNANTLSKCEHILSDVIVNATQRGKLFGEADTRQVYKKTENVKKPRTNNFNSTAKRANSNNGAYEKNLPARQSASYRNKSCKFFAEGHCEKGDKCSYRHDTAVLQKIPFTN